MPIIKVSQAQKLLLNPNPRRKRLLIQFQSSQIDAGNTGQVFIGFGHQPQSTVSDPAAGYPIKQSDAIVKPEAGEKLAEIFKQAVWAIGDADDQSLLVEEESEEPEKPTP